MHSPSKGCWASDLAHDPTVITRTKSLLFAILACFLVACEGESHNPGHTYPNTIDQDLDFEEVLPDDWMYLHCCRRDTNNDGLNEWIVTYRFDLTCTADRGRCPTGACIYQLDGGKPPNILHHELRPPDRDYLCECSCGFTMEDALSGYPGDELIVRDTCSERTTRLTIFHWDRDGSEYAPKGHFSGYSIDVSRDVVTVVQRLPGRAQLSMCCTRQAFENRTYYQHIDQSGQEGEHNYSLIGRECELGFCIGEPEDVTLSPYPEKIVLTFYNHCRYEDEEKIPGYFTEEGWKQLNGCANGECGCRTGCREVKHVQVIELPVAQEQCSQQPSRQCEDYGPDQAIVEATVRCQYIDGSQDDSDTTVEWTLRRRDYHWKLDGATMRP